MNTPYQNFFTSQSGIHSALIETVRLYAKSSYRRPIASHQIEAFQQILFFTESRQRPLILDSGCGTGHSTQVLAQMFPDHDVIGIDKSLSRLGKATNSSLDNFLLVRGDVIDLWRLIAQHPLPIARHYIFYPNPWPKIGHMKRRFHGHPVFSVMLSLAPYLELRTNWLTYAEEMMAALNACGQQPTLALKTDDNAISLFEKKYLAAACPLFVVRNELAGH